MSRFVIHIGLPRTASTTLQSDVFPRVDPSRVHYVGVRQPRGWGTDELYWPLLDAVWTGQRMEAARALLAKSLSSRGVVFLSEEMILVSQGENTWRRKLERLAALLQGQDHQLIATFREPAGALFAYFAEIYPTLPPGSTFERFAYESEAAEIYHYGKLLAELHRHFSPARLTATTFEDVIHGNLSAFASALGVERFDRSSGSLRVTNAKPQDSSFVFTDVPWPLPPALARRVRASARLWELPWVGPAFVRAAERVRRIPALTTRYRVPKPSTHALEKLRRDLAGDTAALREFGISYPV